MRRLLLGRIAVDTGMLMICDPCRVDQFDADTERFVDREYREERFPLTPTEAADSEGEVIVAAVAVSTGNGDGYYPVYVEVPEAADDDIPFVDRVACIIIDCKAYSLNSSAALPHVHKLANHDGNRAARTV
jgi:hypothetical protein